MKVVVAGGGIAGNVMLRQLRLRSDITWLRAYEKRSLEDASPPGLNILLNHNGMACLKEMDPELYKEFCRLGWEANNWSARDMAGNVLYHLPNVVESNDASTASLVARWDLIHAATRCDELIDYSSEVVSVERHESKLAVKIKRTLEEKEEWIRDVDLLIAADGRFSAVRQQLVPSNVYYGPPFVADFRIVVRGRPIPELLNDTCPIWRVYNKPDEHRIHSLYGTENRDIVAAARGFVRVGIMKLDDESYGLFGNVAKADDGPIDQIFHTSDFLYQLFLPSSDGALDETGRSVLQIIKEYGQTAHWARKQETDTVYQAMDGQVLFIGDAAGAIYPSLGQGANISLEDACVAAAVFPNVDLVDQLRRPRRDFIKNMSRMHAKHVADADYFDTEIQNWNDPNGPWRMDLKKLWNGGSLVLCPVTANAENFAQFGQVVPECDDGDLFGEADAQLELSKGVPRLYLMKLNGKRPLRADRITRHCQVTQCLGALGLNEDFYIVVHAEDDHPTLDGLRAFRIPPRSFIKLHVGTWHAGPMWSGPDLERTFVNLELADTNESDHDTILFSNLPPFARNEDRCLRIHNVKTDDSSVPPTLVIPIQPMLARNEK